jgi:hypothetical protein
LVVVGQLDKEPLQQEEPLQLLEALAVIVQSALLQHLQVVVAVEPHQVLEIHYLNLQEFQEDQVVVVAVRVLVLLPQVDQELLAKAMLVELVAIVEAEEVEVEVEPAVLELLLLQQITLVAVLDQYHRYLAQV